MFKWKHCFLNRLLLKYWVVETQLIAPAQACLFSFTLHKIYRFGMYFSYSQMHASLLQRLIEQAWVKTWAELRSGIVTATLSPFIPARLWAVCGSTSTWRSHFPPYVREIWNNLHGVLKTCRLTLFGCVSTKEQNYVEKALILII